MAKSSLHDPFDGNGLPLPPPPRLPATPVVKVDPRLSLPTPVQWHTASDATPLPGPAVIPQAGEPPPSNSALWRKLKRNLLFWQAATDVVSVSVFGPPALTPGQAAKLTIYVHPTEASQSVCTLARAFQHDAELIGVGHLVREVARESVLEVHLSVTNVAASRSHVEFIWRGQPQRLNLDLHVPWESPFGAAPGLVSLGQKSVRIGKVAFNLHILPRQG
jgi:hypothetical protein